MPDYAAMYKRLFNSQTQAIELLQKAQIDTEEMYVSAPEHELKIFKSDKDDEPKKEWKNVRRLVYASDAFFFSGGVLFVRKDDWQQTQRGLKNWQQ